MLFERDSKGSLFILIARGGKIDSIEKELVFQEVFYV